MDELVGAPFGALIEGLRTRARQIKWMTQGTTMSHLILLAALPCAAKKEHDVPALIMLT
jgi:hypothetical protein